MSIDEIRNYVDRIPMSYLNMDNMKQSEMNQLRDLLTPKMTKYIKNTPTAKQSAFLLLNCKEAFYGGAAGGVRLF